MPNCWPHGWKLNNFMARDFATNQQISGSLETLLNGASAATMAGWVRRGASGSAQAFGFTRASSPRICFSVLWFSDNKIYCFQESNSNTYGSITQNLTGWHHICMVFDGGQTGNSDRLKLYFDGVLQTLAFFGTVQSTLWASLPTFRIGRDAGNNAWSTGGFAEPAMWNAALTADEAASLAKGFRPPSVRPSALVSYIPLIREIADLKSGIALTDASTTVSDHPRVIN